MLTIINTSSS